MDLALLREILGGLGINVSYSNKLMLHSNVLVNVKIHLGC